MSLTEKANYAYWKHKLEGNHFEMILKFLWKPKDQSLIMGETNINLTRQFLQANPDMKLSPNLFFDSSDLDQVKIRGKKKFSILSQGPFVTIGFVLENIHMPWSWMHLSENLSISIDDILSYRQLPWCWPTVSAREDLHFSHVIQNPDIPWDCEGLSGMNGLTIEYVKSKMTEDWFWRDIATNLSLNMSPLDLVKNQIVDHGSISGNSKLTIQDVKSNPSAAWNYCLLSRNPGILTETGSGTLFCGDCSSANPNLTIDRVRNDPENLFWSWNVFSSRKFINIDFVLEFPNKNWDWFSLSKNYRIDVSDMIKYRHLPWDWVGASKNPTLRIWHVTEHPEIPWAITGIVDNSFYMDDGYFLESKNKDTTTRKEMIQSLLLESKISSDVILLITGYVSYE